MSIKILDDIVIKSGDKELIRNYFEYSKKVEKAPAPCSFIICGEKLSKVLNSIK
jgi:hypothetical protein